MVSSQDLIEGIGAQRYVGHDPKKRKYSNFALDVGFINAYLPMLRLERQEWLKRSMQPFVNIGAITSLQEGLKQLTEAGGYQQFVTNLNESLGTSAQEIGKYLGPEQKIDFGSWVADLSAKGMTQQDIETYLSQFKWGSLEEGVYNLGNIGVGPIVDYYLNPPTPEQVETRNIFSTIMAAIPTGARAVGEQVIPQLSNMIVAASSYMLQADPVGFLTSISELGRNEATEQLLKALIPDITEEEMGAIFPAPTAAQQFEDITKDWPEYAGIKAPEEAWVKIGKDRHGLRAEYLPMNLQQIGYGFDKPVESGAFDEYREEVQAQIYAVFSQNLPEPEAASEEILSFVKLWENVEADNLLKTKIKGQPKVPDELDWARILAAAQGLGGINKSWAIGAGGMQARLDEFMRQIQLRFELDADQQTMLYRYASDKMHRLLPQSVVNIAQDAMEFYIMGMIVTAGLGKEPIRAIARRASRLGRISALDEAYLVTKLGEQGYADLLKGIRVSTKKVEDAAKEVIDASGVRGYEGPVLPREAEGLEVGAQRPAAVVGREAEVAEGGAGQGRTDLQQQEPGLPGRQGQLELEGKQYTFDEYVAEMEARNAEWQRNSPEHTRLPKERATELAREQAQAEANIKEIEARLADLPRATTKAGKEAKPERDMLEEWLGAEYANKYIADTIPVNETEIGALADIKAELDRVAQEIERRASARTRAEFGKMKRKAGGAAPPGRYENQYPHLTTQSLQEYENWLYKAYKQIQETAAAERAAEAAPVEPVFVQEGGGVPPENLFDEVVEAHSEIQKDVGAIRESLKNKRDINSRLTKLILNGTERELRVINRLLKRIEAKEGKLEEDLAAAKEKLKALKALHRTKTADIQKMKDALRIYIKDVLPLMGKRQQQTMLTAVAKVKNERDLLKALDKLEEYAETNARKSLHGTIEKELKDVATKKKQGIVQGKMEPSAQETIDELTKANFGKQRLSRQEALAEMDRNMLDYQNGEISMETMLERNDFLQHVGVSEMTSAELDDTLGFVREVIAKGRDAFKEENVAYRERMTNLGDRFTNEVTGGKPLTGVPGQDVNITTNWLRKFAHRQLGLEELINTLTRRSRKPNYESDMSIWARNIPKARRTETEGMQSANAVIQRAARDTFGKKNVNQELNRLHEDVDLGIFRNVDDQPQRMKYTRSELIDIYMKMHDPRLEETLRFGNKFTDQMMEAAIGALREEDMAWGDFLLQFYDNYWNRINQVYKKYYHVNLGKNEGYSPLSRSFDYKVPEHILFLRDRQYYARTTNPSLKARVESIQPIVFRDVNRTLVSHVTEMEHFIAWTGAIKEWRSIFMNPQFRKSVMEVHGDDILRVMDRYIDNLARGGINKNITNRYLDMLRRNVTRAALGVKPAVALKQIPSGLAYSTQMPMRDFIMYVADFWRHPLQNYRTLMKLSPELRARFKEGFERDVVAAKQKGADQWITGKDNVLNKFMGPIQMMDKFAVVQGSWAKYKSELKILEKAFPEMTQGERIQQAILEAERVTSRTQPSFNIESLSTLQNGGSYMKAATMFQNQPNKYWRMYYSNFDTLFTGRGSRPKALYNLALSYAVLPMIFQFSSDAFQIREEHLTRAALFGPVNYLLIAGPAAQSMIGWFGGETFDYEVSPIMDVMNEMQYAISKGRRIKGAWDDPLREVQWEDVIGLAESIATVGGEATGLPTPWLIQAERGIREGDPRQLVFSRWALQPGGPTDFDKAQKYLDEVGVLQEKEPGQFAAEFYTTKDLATDLGHIFGKKLPSDVIKDSKAQPLVKAFNEMRLVDDQFSIMPNVKLKDINTDPTKDFTIEDYYKQWQTIKNLSDEGNLVKYNEQRKIFGDANLGNISRRTYDLLVDYMNSEDPEQFVKDHPELDVNPSVQWLKDNPKENAILALWGRHSIKLRTMAAYNEFKRLVDELDIPDDGVPPQSLPPETSVENYFKYNDVVDEHGAGSYEAMLIVVDDPQLKDFLYPKGKEITQSREFLEINVRWGDLYDEIKLMKRGYEDKTEAEMLGMEPPPGWTGTDWDAKTAEQRRRAYIDWEMSQVYEANPTFWSDDKLKDAYEQGFTFTKEYLEMQEKARDTGSPSSKEVKLFKITHLGLHNEGLEAHRTNESWGWADNLSDYVDLETGELTQKGKGLQLWVDNKDDFERYDGYSDPDSNWYIADEDDRHEEMKKMMADPDFRKLHRRYEALDTYGFTDELADLHILYYEEVYNLQSIPGKYTDYSADWFMYTNENYYQAWLAADDSRGEIPFDELPDPEYDRILRQPEMQQVLNDWASKGIEKDSYMAFLSANGKDDIVDDWHRLDAYKLFYPTDLIEKFVGFFWAVPLSDTNVVPQSIGWAEKRYLMANQDLLLEAIQRGGLDIRLDPGTDPSMELVRVYIGLKTPEARAQFWENNADVLIPQIIHAMRFDKVPTPEVEALYNQYLMLSGADRYRFRYEHPDLDAWGQRAFGWQPVQEKFVIKGGPGEQAFGEAAEGKKAIEDARKYLRDLAMSLGY